MLAYKSNSFLHLFYLFLESIQQILDISMVLIGRFRFVGQRLTKLLFAGGVFPNFA